MRLAVGVGFDLRRRDRHLGLGDGRAAVHARHHTASTATAVVTSTARHLGGEHRQAMHVMASAPHPPEGVVTLAEVARPPIGDEGHPPIQAEGEVRPEEHVHAAAQRASEVRARAPTRRCRHPVHDVEFVERTDRRGRVGTNEYPERGG